MSDYRQEIRDRSNALLAYFNPKEGPDGKTHDRSGRVVGSGDQRARFIRDKYYVKPRVGSRAVAYRTN